MNKGINQLMNLIHLRQIRHSVIERKVRRGVIQPTVNYFVREEGKGRARKEFLAFRKVQRSELRGRRGSRREIKYMDRNIDDDVIEYYVGS